MIFGGYMLLFGALVAGTLVLRLRRRKERKPFPDHLRLRRGPGESLRQTIDRLDDALLNAFVAAFCLPLIASGVLLWVITNLDDHTQLMALGTTLGVLLLGLILLGLRIARRLERWRNTYLGYFGERVVAEALEPLKAEGYHVFHDVPAGGIGRRFNIDHVIVAPTGVFSVETKTRRKGEVRPEFAAHEIIYDGSQLIYPWGEDQFGLDQARDQAAWLAKWLKKELDLEVPVTPILTFPGWTVITRQPGPITVLSPAQIPTAVTVGDAAKLGPARIAAIAQRLDKRCRDVEF
tara:strand:- start:129 stop:1004 length:876 start_codon:yes stop_codon:yes gene_type:complete